MLSYETKVGGVEGYSYQNYLEKLEKYKKELNEKGCFIEEIMPVRAIVIYKEPKIAIEDKEIKQVVEILGGNNESN